MTGRRRRTVLAGLAGVLAGCGASDGDPTATASGTRRPTTSFGATPVATPTATPRSTETATETDTTTPTETDTETDSPTETPDEVERVIRESRADLETAIRVLDGIGVLDDGALIRHTDGQYPPVDNYGDVSIPTDRAERRLDGVSGRAGDRQSTVNALLLFGEYVGQKLIEHRGIGTALNRFDSVLAEYPTDGSLDTAASALERFEQVTEAIKKARGRLGQVESVGGIPGVDNTSVAGERREQRTIVRIDREYLPATRGVLKTVALVETVEIVHEHLQRGAYVEAAETAENLLSNAEGLREDLNTALGRNVRHHADGVRTFRCIARGTTDVIEELQRAAEAYPDDTETACTHLDEAARLISRTESECGRSLPMSVGRCDGGSG